MRVEWTDEFDRWLTSVEELAAAGDQLASRKLDHVAAELQLLVELTGPPMDETAQLKRVRQRRRHEVWRISHAFDELVAVRLICWFPPQSNSVVVTVFAGDKKRIGDVFYNSVGSRADAEIDRWLNQHGGLTQETETSEDGDDEAY